MGLHPLLSRPIIHIHNTSPKATLTHDHPAMATRAIDSHPTGEPPAKKRRFFADPSDDVALTEEASTPTTSNVALSSPAEAGTSDAGHGSMQFDQQTFESFVGTSVEPHILKVIRENCGDNIETAINMFFDGSWKRIRNQIKPSALTRAMETETKPQALKPPDSQQTANTPLRTMPPSRYVGAFGVEGWATRSGANLIKHGDVVKIERQKAMKKVDVIVRFTNTNGMEVGRLAKDTANWVSTLMDLQVCQFEGTCVYAPDRLRTNDTVFLQLRCSLLRAAFDRKGLQLSDNRTTGLFEERETFEERDLRLRQVALVRLFQEISLNPSRMNAAAARHQRQDLLDAAELAEKKDKEAPKKKNDASESSTPSEDEDGEELQQDQLDALYKKAQSFDFDTPEAEPAETFNMTLRPYQKQALHWMLAKERNEKEKNREASMHPLWEEYTWPTKDFDDKEVPQVVDQPCFYMNPYSGDLSLDFPVQEQYCLGGILADEMGLGKTIQMLSLIHSHRSQIDEDASYSSRPIPSVNNLPRLPSSATAVVSAPRTTLVVAPMSLLAQWQSETENASKEGMLIQVPFLK